MKKSRVVSRDELGEDTLRVLKEFEGWFLPATAEEVGKEFFMFLKWLEKNDYKLVSKD